MATKIQDADVLAVLHDKIAQNGVRQTARDLGFSAPFISDVARGKRNLSKTMADRLGYYLISIPPRPPAPPRIWGKKK